MGVGYFLGTVIALSNSDRDEMQSWLERGPGRDGGRFGPRDSSLQPMPTPRNHTLHHSRWAVRLSGRQLTHCGPVKATVRASKINKILLGAKAERSNKSTGDFAVMTDKRREFLWANL